MSIPPGHPISTTRNDGIARSARAKELFPARVTRNPTDGRTRWVRALCIKWNVLARLPAGLRIPRKKKKKKK